MATKFLDDTGLKYLWSKLKTYIQNATQVDDDFSTVSENPVQNKVVADAVNSNAQNINLLSEALANNMSELNQKNSEQDIFASNLSVALSSLNAAVSALADAIGTYDPAVIEQIAGSISSQNSYLWAEVDGNTTTVFKGLKNGTLKDKQTAIAWAILMNGAEILKVSDNKATASVLEVTDELQLGDYTLSVRSTGGWSIT